jgi:hypothetical protein
VVNTEGLTQFLLARFAEDEKVARAASVGGRWRYEGTDGIGAWTLYDEEWRIGTLTTYRHDDYDYARVPNFRDPRDIDVDANGAHIARHDPARVLAECEAKRLMVRHAAAVSKMDNQVEHEFGTGGPVPWAEDHGVLLLRFLALPYADHPDYQQGWKP